MEEKEQLCINYHLLPPISGKITDEKVARINVKFSGALQTGHQGMDSSATSDGPHGPSQDISAELLEWSRVREQVSQQRRR